jgi:hypothetical protein
MNLLLPALVLCALLVAPPAQAAPPDPLLQGMDDHDAQLLGWSANGQRFVVRLYQLVPFTPRPAIGELPFCDGYKNHEGNAFRGGLVWLVYEKGRLLATLPLLDSTQCTPEDEAKKRLEAAKKRVTSLGIQLDTPGQELLAQVNTPSITVSEGPHAPYTIEYEYRTSTQTSDPKTGMQRGTVEQQVFVSIGEKRQKVLGRKGTYEFSKAAAGYWTAGLDRVWLSPSGSTVAVVGYERVGNMAGGRKSLRLLGVLGWSGNTLKPL